MRVGVDIDGVLIDTPDVRINLALKFEEKYNIKIPTIDKTESDTRNVFKWDRELDWKFWEESSKAYYSTFPTPESVEAIKKLRKLGHEIFIITARGSDIREQKIMGVENLKELTRKWCEQYDIPSENIFFAESGSKSKICVEQKIDVLIDDFMRNVEEVSKVIPVIAFSRKYNEKAKTLKSNYKVYRTDSWNEIINIVEYRL